MLLLAATAALAAIPPTDASSTGVRATVQAQAIVRIITGAAVRLGQGALVGEAPSARQTIVHTEGGLRPAKLIEFQ